MDIIRMVFQTSLVLTMLTGLAISMYDGRVVWVALFSPALVISVVTLAIKIGENKEWWTL